MKQLELDRLVLQKDKCSCCDDDIDVISMRFTDKKSRHFETVLDPPTVENLVCELIEWLEKTQPDGSTFMDEVAEI
jgi:hypothetical protein